MLAEYTGAVMILAIATVLACALLGIHLLVGPRRSFTEKDEPAVSDDVPGPVQALKDGGVAFVTVVLGLLAVVIGLVYLIAWFLLRTAEQLMTRLGESKIYILTRVLGIVLAALAVQ